MARGSGLCAARGLSRWDLHMSTLDAYFGEDYNVKQSRMEEHMTVGLPEYEATRRRCMLKRLLLAICHQ